MPDIQESIERIRKKLVVEKSTKNIGTPVRIDDLDNILKELNRLKEENAELETQLKIEKEANEAISKALENSVSKDKIIEKIREIQFECQQEWINFRDCKELNILQELLGDENNE